MSQILIYLQVQKNQAILCKVSTDKITLAENYPYISAVPSFESDH